MNVQEKVKGFFGKLKEKWGALSKRVKIVLCGVLAAVVALVVVLLATMTGQSYVPLFSGLNSTDLSSVVTYLSDNGVSDYKVQDDGTILVPADQEVQLRANLLMADYPTSGFSYSTYLDNVGSLTTEAEREKLSLMEIQDRLAATIRCLDGVKDAVVNINLSQESTYVLDREDAVPATASVVVTMKDGGSLPEGMVKSIQTLLRTSIQNLDMENVGIVDSLGNTYSDGTDLAGAQDASQLKVKLEQQQNNLIRTDILQLLAPLYGAENIRVSVRTTVNVDRSVTDAKDYSMEEDATGNEGLIGKKIYDQQIIRDGETAAGGTVGTDSNADLNTYVNEQYRPDGDEQALVNSGQNDYLYDQKNTQTEHLSGVITDVMVSITINEETAGTTATNQLVTHVAKAAGISEDVQNDKISILTAPFYEEENKPLVDVSGIPEWVLYAAAAGLAAFVLLMLLLALLRRRRRKRLEEEGELDSREYYEPVAAAAPPPTEGADIMNVDTEQSIEMRRKVRKFAETSPEIAAQMVRNWLKEGDERT